LRACFGEIKNRKTSKRKPYARSFVETNPLIVGAAMRDRACHRRKRCDWISRHACSIEETRESAHAASVSRAECVDDRTIHATHVEVRSFLP
jgi:hypothetical protein